MSKDEALRDLIERVEAVPGDREIVTMLRSTAREVTGGNCAFIGDDLRLLAHLATRAIKAGLTNELSPEMQVRLRTHIGTGG